MVEEKEWIEVVSAHPSTLKFVENQTEAICLVAVQENGYALQYVKKPTKTMCLEAVNENIDILKFVEKIYELELN